MTEAILTLGIFAVPILTAAAIECHKEEKKRRAQEFAAIRERDYQYGYRVGFKKGIDYKEICMDASSRNGLKRNAQQVDKEIERYAQTVN